MCSCRLQRAFVSSWHDFAKSDELRTLTTRQLHIPAVRLRYSKSDGDYFRQDQHQNPSNIQVIEGYYFERLSFFSLLLICFTSASITQISKFPDLVLVNAILFPSGDQAAPSLWLFPVTASGSSNFLKIDFMFFNLKYFIFRG